MSNTWSSFHKRRKEASWKRDVVVIAVTLLIGASVGYSTATRPIVDSDPVEVGKQYCHKYGGVVNQYGNDYKCKIEGKERPFP